jgi:hypothetical protein
MAGGPEITSPADAGTGGSPTGPPHPPRPPVARVGGDDPAPKPASGFTSDQLRRDAIPLLSSSDQLPKSCHVKDEVAPHPTRRTVYKVANKRIPRISRRRSSEAPADPRRSPQITATEALLTAVIPAYPRPARNYQDRPATPEVAGSSPVAPVENTLQIGIFCCPLWRNRPPAFDRSRAHPARASGRGPVSVKPCKSPCSVAGDGVRVLGDPAAIPQADRPAVLGGADWNYEWPEASCSSGCCDVAAVSFRVW